MLVDIFIPCFIDQLQPQTAMNMVKLLEQAGCVVNYNIEQTCCGNPAFNAGYWDECKEVGEKLITEFPNDRYIVTPSALCLHTVKNNYTKIFYNSVLHNEYKQVQKNFHEFSHFVVNVLKHYDFNSSFEGKGVYLNSCTAQRECAITIEPIKLLEKVKGLELVKTDEEDVCCGFGGNFSLKNEALSIAMAEKKVEAILKTGAKYIISADLTCLIHLQTYITKQNIDLKTIHLIDVLASN